MKKILIFAFLFLVIFSISFAQLANILSNYGDYIFLGAFCALISMICQIALSRVDQRYGNVGILLGVIIFIYLIAKTSMSSMVITFSGPYIGIIVALAAIYIIINLFRTVGTHHGNWGKMVFGLGLAIVVAYAANVVMQYIPPSIPYVRMIFNIIIAFGVLLFLWGFLGFLYPHVKAAAPAYEAGKIKKAEEKVEHIPPIILKEIGGEYKIDMDALRVVNEIISLLQKKDDPKKIDNRIENLLHLVRDEEKRVGRISSLISNFTAYVEKLNGMLYSLLQTWGKAGRKASKLQSEIMKLKSKIETYRRDNVEAHVSELKEGENLIRENSKRIEQLISSMRSHLQRALHSRGDAQATAIMEDYPKALTDALNIKKILESEMAKIKESYDKTQRIIQEIKVFHDTVSQLQTQVQTLRHEVEMEGGPTKK
ncbi:MAG: hypothetical protein QXP04_00100 [Candidatus Nanoarchaeia archaeon]|nr:hypothetical protein [Candidatus Jingweiarchaeum tengchongense]